jgi:RNA polymerase sigma-70 factor (ECF subfamily)
LEDITGIIKGCIKRKQQYQRMVYDRYCGFALKIIFRYIYRYEKAVDVMNDGFVKLFANFERFRISEDEDNEKLLLGYLKKIMINTAIDELRKENMMPEIGGIPEYVWNYSGKKDEADQQTLYKDIITMIKELPPQYRVVFNMYVIEGYNQKEIATLFKNPVGKTK